LQGAASKWENFLNIFLNPVVYNSTARPQWVARGTGRRVCKDTEHGLAIISTGALFTPTLLPPPLAGFVGCCCYFNQLQHQHFHALLRLFSNNNNNNNNT